MRLFLAITSFFLVWLTMIVFYDNASIKRMMDNGHSYEFAVEKVIYE